MKRKRMENTNTAGTRSKWLKTKHAKTMKNTSQKYCKFAK